MLRYIEDIDSEKLNATSHEEGMVPWHIMAVTPLPAGSLRKPDWGGGEWRSKPISDYHQASYCPRKRAG